LHYKGYHYNLTNTEAKGWSLLYAFIESYSECRPKGNLVAVSEGTKIVRCQFIAGPWPSRLIVCPSPLSSAVSLFLAPYPQLEHGQYVKALVIIRLVNTVITAMVTFMTSQISVQKAIGNRIRELRKRQGWSQEYLGDKCSIHRSHMGAIERGETNLTLSTLLAIAAQLDTKIATLFYKAD